MVKIRLSRTGKKNSASYRIVITPAREKRESNAIEYIGYYLPHTKKVEINQERAKYWIGVGAQPTETVKRFLVKDGLMEAPKFKRVYKTEPSKKTLERRAKKEAKLAKAASA